MLKYWAHFGYRVAKLSRLEPLTGFLEASGRQTITSTVCAHSSSRPNECCQAAVHFSCSFCWRQIIYAASHSTVKYIKPERNVNGKCYKFLKWQSLEYLADLIRLQYYRIMQKSEWYVDNNDKCKTFVRVNKYRIFDLKQRAVSGT